MLEAALMDFYPVGHESAPPDAQAVFDAMMSEAGAFVGNQPFSTETTDTGGVQTLTVKL